MRKYLLLYQNELKDETGWVYERYTRYGLCNAQPPKEPNWYQWHDGSGKSIIVFQYITQYSSSPELPETLVSAQLMHEDAVYGTITAPEKLESLRTMLTGAQVEPKQSSSFEILKLYLRLEFSDGTQMEMSTITAPVMLSETGKQCAITRYWIWCGTLVWRTGRKRSFSGA